MTYFLRVGPGPSASAVSPSLTYVSGGAEYLPHQAETPTSEKTPHGISLRTTTLVTDLNSNGCRYNLRRVNDASGNRVPNLYVLTSLIWGSGGDGNSFSSYPMRYTPSYITNPSSMLLDSSRIPHPNSEFSTTDGADVCEHFFYVNTFANTSTTTVTLTADQEVPAEVRPYGFPLQCAYSDTCSTAASSRALFVSTSGAATVPEGNAFFFLNDVLISGPVVASPLQDSATQPSVFYTIRSVAKMAGGGDTPQFFYLSLYNPDGPNGPLVNFEFEKSDFASAEPFRFIPRKKRGVAGSAVFTFDIQSKATGLFFQIYRYTTRSPTGELIEHFAVSRSDVSDAETEMEIVQGAAGVFGAFKIRSFVYSTDLRGDVFLRFDPSDPWTIHAVTGAYNENTDGFEIFEQSHGLQPTRLSNTK